MTHRYHYLALGSNIRSQFYVPTMIDLWARVFGQVYLGPLFSTDPVGVALDSGWPELDAIEPKFVNACFAVLAPEQWIDDQWCKSFSKLLEVALDRPLDLPNRRRVSRTIDIDYLFSDASDVSLFLRQQDSYSCLGLAALVGHIQPHLIDESQLKSTSYGERAKHINKNDFALADKIHFVW